MSRVRLALAVTLSLLVSAPGWAAATKEEGPRSSVLERYKDKHPGKHRPRPTPSPSETVITLYFNHLPWAATNEDLERLVSQHCEVISSRIATDRETGRSRGFGFVEVPGACSRRTIDALNGFSWAGKALEVRRARPEDQQRAGSRR